MKILELFCGTKSISNAFKEKGHEVYTIDWEKNFKPTLVANIGTLSEEDIIKLCNGKPDVIWASPDCTTFSMAGIWNHRTREENGNIAPKSEYVSICEKGD